ncbi:hypothetical protein CEP54_012716 [Fusarium duplospermum]|uniref:Uncharacterized protein n=1 Tax=Fusarium duplospermum TaxID=1325734 RepID=A0A428P730_9HYPO|nr:hypothetical protein CEP54_012716 [Fusarium duplospermum]
MWGNVFCLAFTASLALEAVAQTTITVGADDEDDSFSSVPTSTSKSEGPDTCGYVDGDPDDAVTCPSSCALLFVSGRDSFYYGCCNDDQCNIPTTCIESGTASGRATLACTEGLSSRCKTWTWPDRSAESYACATTRTKLTVATEATITTTVGDDITVTAGPSPTFGDGDDNDDDSGSPGIGWEHDLDSRQRVGAGIGSGVTGGLLLIFFG